jgi:hypothetical protein
MVTVGSYGNYSSNNYGVNTLYVTIDGVTIYFSYQTIVAFEYEGELTISENIWSVTTGKHLNMIEPEKSIRVPNEEFRRELTRMLDSIRVNPEIYM